jgi:hypothetical protein
MMLVTVTRIASQLGGDASPDVSRQPRRSAGPGRRCITGTGAARDRYDEHADRNGATV